MSDFYKYLFDFYKNVLHDKSAKESNCFRLSKGFFDLLYHNWFLKQSKNIILYGAPGVGKTFKTKELSVAKIINLPSIDTNNDYDRLSNENRIVFTTFHQSIAYEDFVEGIRPETNQGQISYTIKDGYFKKICYAAFASYFKIDQVSTGLYRFDIKELIANLFSTNKKYQIAYNKLKSEVEKKIKESTEPNIPVITGFTNFVLIIDEINRGNVSQVFGELITLIEEDKRYGGTNHTRAYLPYSGELFSVPPNLYIIGTMNSADRSAEALDTALRRRFIFEEMRTNYSLLDDIIINAISIRSFLEKLNSNIIDRKGPEFEIGHSYFMTLSKHSSFNDFLNIFILQILPLLQEMFYNDIEEINEILSGLGVIDNKIVKPRQELMKLGMDVFITYCQNDK
jgi:5-methylcytosine-specific restriction protein B